VGKKARYAFLEVTIGVSVLADQRFLLDLGQTQTTSSHTGVSATPMIDPKISDTPGGQKMSHTISGWRTSE
jgi:hypothetical protein